MIKPSFPNNENERIEALKSYNILDTIPEQEYDNLTLIASQICNTPISLVSLVDPERQWFKSHHGLDATETPRDLAFCAHAINQPNEVLIVPDSRKDERFHDNPLALGAPNVIFYAGAPLNTPDGYSLGTLCVIDNKPRNLKKDQIRALKALADQFVILLELRKRNAILEITNSKITDLNERLESFASRLTHDLKAPVRSVQTLVQFLKEDYSNTLDLKGIDFLNRIDEKTNYLNTVIKGMLNYSKSENKDVQFEEFDFELLIKEIESALKGESEFRVNLKTNKLKNIFQYKFGISCTIQNLMSNSIKFCNKDICEIDISIKEDDDHYLIEFSDNGPGIPQSKRLKVFNLFETLGTTQNESTGIGLATVKRILEHLDSEITIVDRDDKKEGIKFLIKLKKKQVT